MARESKRPAVLRALFASLDDDPRMIAGSLARHTIIERYFAGGAAGAAAPSLPLYTLPAIATTVGGCDQWFPIQPLGAPAPRSQHTAIWTGAEMIVWGGVASGVPLGDGGRYNPALDSWAAVTGGTNTPAARFGHTAVWTGSEMIVWGGTGAGGVRLNSGGRYDPVTNGWLATSTGAGAPTAREAHTAVWLAGRMIIWGGFDGVSRLNSGGRYDPVDDSWSATSTASGVPEGRSFHAAISTGSLMMIMGGFTGSQGYSAATYDPVQDLWTPLAAGGPRRLYLTAIWNGTEMIDWGGYVAAFSSYLTNLGYRYNAAGNAWATTSQGANVPAAREYHSAVWARDGMLVWGGYGGASGALQSGGRYAPPADAWSPVSITASTPSPRLYHSAVWDGSAMIVWGGASAYAANPPGLGDGALYFIDPPAGIGNSLALTRSATLDLAWTGAAGATSYSVLRCDASGSPCVPATSAATPTVTSYSEPLDATSRYYAITSVNNCGSTP